MADHSLKPAKHRRLVEYLLQQLPNPIKALLQAILISRYLTLLVSQFSYTTHQVTTKVEKTTFVRFACVKICYQRSLGARIKPNNCYLCNRIAQIVYNIFKKLGGRDSNLHRQGMSLICFHLQYLLFYK